MPHRQARFHAGAERSPESLQPCDAGHQLDMIKDCAHRRAAEQMCCMHAKLHGLC